MATWYAAYRESDGELLSVGTSLPDDGVALGLAIKEYQARPDRLRGFRWSSVLLDFEDLRSELPVLLRRHTWVDRFTADERWEIHDGSRSHASPVMRDYLTLIHESFCAEGGFVDLRTPDVGLAIAALVSVGVLQPERVAQILDEAGTI